MRILNRVCFLVTLLIGFAFFAQLSCADSALPTHLAYSQNDRQHVQTGELPPIYTSMLPQEARDALDLIKQGGPFPYPKDGSVFGNREKRLPIRARGYYREYTVKTRGSRDRGARRIISGADGEYYYTDDHYNTFKLIRGARP